MGAPVGSHTGRPSRLTLTHEQVRTRPCLRSLAISLSPTRTHTQAHTHMHIHTLIRADAALRNALWQRGWDPDELDDDCWQVINRSLVSNISHGKMLQLFQALRNRSSVYGRPSALIVSMMIDRRNWDSS